MRPNVYVTDHIHSKVVSNAFSSGCNGKLVPPLRLLDGPAVFYGILRGCGGLIHECEWIDRDYYHIDHGYLKRGHYEGYYRVTKNGLQADMFQRGPTDSGRFRALGLGVKPWGKTGRNIVVCPMTGFIGEHLGIDPRKWCESVVRELSLYTDRPIIVKQKGQGDLSETLTDAWCLVTHSSNAAIDAIISGVPAIVLGDSAAEPVSWTFEDIEKPDWPERSSWLYGLAWRQFTLDEMRSGFCWQAVK